MLETSPDSMFYIDTIWKTYPLNIFVSGVYLPDVFSEKHAISACRIGVEFLQNMEDPTFVPCRGRWPEEIIRESVVNYFYSNGNSELHSQVMIENPYCWRGGNYECSVDVRENSMAYDEPEGEIFETEIRISRSSNESFDASDPFLLRGGLELIHPYPSTLDTIALSKLTNEQMALRLDPSFEIPENIQARSGEKYSYHVEGDNVVLRRVDKGVDEPPRVCRRLIVVSYAAMSSVSRAA
jgi:hypothetical protein